MAKLTGYKYFLYSEEQNKEKNNILNKTGYVFEPGTIIINGSRKKFTSISDKNSIPRFIDTKIIAEGNVENMTYIEPKKTKRKGI